jgi:predicted ferric reductase
LVRQVLNHPAYGFKSVGHLVVVLLYLGINIALIVTYVDYRTLIGPAKRCGWYALSSSNLLLSTTNNTIRIAFCNIAFLVFLALKNTPLAFLTAHSYETLNPLHQVAGYTTMVTALVHFTVECLHMERTHKAYELVEHEQIFGMIAACSMFVIFLTTLGMKKLRYELFYIVHVTMFMLILITLGLHRPDLADKEVIVILIAASMWGSDRIIRGFRILYYSRANEATIHPLPHGGTRIVLCRSPPRAIPGTHCFLWLPTIRKFETHPFTIVRTSPNLELVINAYDGFTSDLHNYAVKYPGKSLRASVDGPYGAIPDFASTADKVILIAGGSGASFTFGVALDAIKRLPASSNTTIDFVWTVREEGMRLRLKSCRMY